MKKIAVTTDSASDMPEAFAKKNNITVIPFHIDLENVKEFSGNLFEKMRQADNKGVASSVKTSQPSLQQYLTVFKDKLEEFEEIIHVSISSKLSGAYNSAMQAKKFLGKDANRVHILDSEIGSGAQTLLVLDIIEDLKKELNTEQIINNFKENIKRNFLFFVWEDGKWLKNGGRLPAILPIGLQKMKQMNIGLVMRAKNGLLKPMAIKRNVIDIATPLFEEFNKTNKNFKGKIKAIITHADNEKEADKLKKMLLSLNNVEIIYTDIMSAVLGSHAGPGLVVLNFEQYENSN